MSKHLPGAFRWKTEENKIEHRASNERPLLLSRRKKSSNISCLNFSRYAGNNGGEQALFFIFWEKTHLCCVGRKPRWATSNPPLPSLCSLFKTQHDMWHTIKRCKVWACVCKVRWVGGRGGGLISLTGEYKQNKHAFMLRRFLPRSLVHTTAPHLIRLVFLSGRPERSLSSIPPVAGALTW